MCTAVTYNPHHRHYFGRNLDLDISYGESIVITPRSQTLSFRCVEPLSKHNAIIGIAIVSKDYPLYYDAINEYGLAMAGLNFPENAKYFPHDAAKRNIAPFEFIPWILGQCQNVPEAISLLKTINPVNIPFSESLPLTPLHWIIADKESAVTVESTEEGLCIYENEIGILTNSPPFRYHMYNLKNYLNLTREPATNRFAPSLSWEPFSRGTGGFGLPGDLSSPSRFIRAAFTKLNAESPDSNAECISQFFHILDSVSHSRGCVKIAEKFQITVYSSCCDMDQCVYYYKTYDNSAINAVSLFHENLDNTELISYPLRKNAYFNLQNE